MQNDIEKAIEEFEDNAYHESLKPEISIKSKVLAMKALQEKQEREWIPVTERLPDRGERVIATAGYGVFEMYLNIHNKWIRNGFDWLKFFKAPVTYWMPMPEPPEVTE